MSSLVRSLKRVIKITPTMTADDNADNDVAFDWITVPDVFQDNGVGAILQSVAILDGYDFGEAIELVFCRGGDDDGTAPTSAQGLLGGAGTGSAVVDITQAEAQALEICGHINMTYSEALNKEYGIPLVTPTENNELIETIYTEAQRGTFEGVVNHYHITRRKIDCAGFKLNEVLK